MGRGALSPTPWMRCCRGYAVPSPSKSLGQIWTTHPWLPTQADLEQASGQVLRLYQDGGGKLRRHQEAQEQADIDQEAQTHPEPGPEPVQTQEG
jgi:hypothetical protein